MRFVHAAPTTQKMPLEVPPMQTIGLIVIIIIAVVGLIWLQKRFFPRKGTSSTKKFVTSGPSASGGGDPSDGDEESGGSAPNRGKLLTNIVTLANQINSWGSPS